MPASWTGSLRGSSSSKWSVLWLILMSKWWPELCSPHAEKGETTAALHIPLRHLPTVILWVHGCSESARDLPPPQSLLLPMPAAAKADPDPPQQRLAPGGGSGLLGWRMLFPGTTNELSRFLHFSRVKAIATPLGSHKTTARSRTLAGASKSDSFPFPIPLASGHDPSPMLLI